MEQEARQFLDGGTPPPDETPRSIGGRPNGYDPVVISTICDLLASGKKLDDIAAHPGFPSRATFFRWIEQHPEAANEYALALEWRAERLVDEMIEIIDDKSCDLIQSEAGEGGLLISKPNPTAIVRSQAQVDLRKWILVKRLAKKYGEQPAIEQQVLPPASRDGDDARIINPDPSGSIENHPMRESLLAWEREAKRPLQRDGA